MSMMRTSLTSGGIRLVAVRMISGRANASSLGRTRTSIRRSAATSVLHAASTASRKPGGTSDPPGRGHTGRSAVRAGGRGIGGSLFDRLLYMGEVQWRTHRLEL